MRRTARSVFSNLACPSSLTRVSELLTHTHSPRASFFPVRLRVCSAKGSGKTSVGKILAARLGRRFVDVDDDVLEVAWAPQRVSDVLREVGDDAFVQREGEALMAHKVTNAVLSLSGSNPLHPSSLEHVAKDGLIVYLDIAPAEILARCERMKVDRIVGQSSHSLESILAFRKSVYENSYDLRVIITHGETPEQIAHKIQGMLQRREAESYVSTRGYDASLSPSDGAKLDFLDVVAQGLSPDRGLFVPAHLDALRFSSRELQRLQHLSYQELALRVMERFPLGDRLHPSALRTLLYEGYASFNAPEILPVVPLRSVLSPAPSAASTSVPAFHERMWLMETFHGPTASFKDLSLQLLPKLLRVALENQRRPVDSLAQQPTAIPRVGLLVATSGDTGTAALDGFSRQADMPVMVLYPSNGVSIVQRAQMQTTPGDVLVLGVDSDFDFCQGLVKDIFNDAKLRAEFQRIVPNLLLSSANSMNWGRFLPQIVFSISSYLRLVSAGELQFGDPLDLVVPTGNFGNILGAVYAQRVLGLPLGRIVCASNSNNVLFEFLRTGKYDLRNRKFAQTVSPSIDILVSSNLERFLHLLARDDHEREQVKRMFEQLARVGHFEVPETMTQRMQQQVQAGWASEQQCLDAIKDTHDRTGVLIGQRGEDTHSLRISNLVGKCTAHCSFLLCGLLFLSRSSHRRRRACCQRDAGSISFRGRIGGVRLQSHSGARREHGALRQISQRNVQSVWQRSEDTDRRCG